ncbi:hypothetical protein FF1_030228 [Malus domestica]
MVFFKCFKSNTITILANEGDLQDWGTMLKLSVPLTGPKALVLPIKDNLMHIKSWSSEVSWEVTDFGRPNMKKKACTLRILILNHSHHVHDNSQALLMHKISEDFGTTESVKFVTFARLLRSLV